MFNFLYGGDLIKPNGSVGTVRMNGQFYSFDQAEFFEKQQNWFSNKLESMDDIGYIYVPSKCNNSLTMVDDDEGTKCRLAFALHGCSQTRFAQLLQICTKLINNDVTFL
jgi:hypothetical protein